MRRSICMATYNGAHYIQQQLDSILSQMRADDELIISDDGSTDGTISIIEAYADSRIRLLNNTSKHGVLYNFENALKHAQGDIIFFADQDDVWLPQKMDEVEAFLKGGEYDLVLSNCSMTDATLQIIKPRYYDEHFPMRVHPLIRWAKGGWLGACMAFTQQVKDSVLPFPPHVAAHDIWVGMYSMLHFRCGYLDKPLQLYRRHDATVSFSGEKSTNPIWYRIQYRLCTAWFLLRSYFRAE